MGPEADVWATADLRPGWQREGIVKETIWFDRIRLSEYC